MSIWTTYNFQWQRSKRKCGWLQTSYRCGNLSIIDPWPLAASNSCETAFEPRQILVWIFLSNCVELVSSRVELQRVPLLNGTLGKKLFLGGWPPEVSILGSHGLVVTLRFVNIQFRNHWMTKRLSIFNVLLTIGLLDHSPRAPVIFWMSNYGPDINIQWNLKCPDTRENLMGKRCFRKAKKWSNFNSIWMKIFS